MPNWTRVTNPISQPESDKSGGIALATIGQGIESGATVADTIAKDIIKRDTDNTVKPIREDFTNSLMAARDQLNNSSVVPAPVQTGQGSTAQNILPEGQTAAPPPSGVKSGLDKIQSIQLSMENGKVNDTYYDMRLKEAVTSIRSRYGDGYGDYIDAEVSKITGRNPANSLVQNLMTDINRLQTNKKTEADKMTDAVMKSGYPNSQGMLQKLQTEGDKALPEVRDWYARQTMFDSDIKRRDAIRSSNKGTKEDIANDRHSDFENLSGSKLSTALDSITTVPGITTPGKVIDIMQDAAANPGKYDDAQMRQLGIMVGTLKAKYTSDLQAEARLIKKDSDGRSYSFNSDVGSTKIDGTIESRGKAFDSIIDSLIKGGVAGVGVAYQQAIHAKAVLDGGVDRLVSDKEMGEYFTNIATFKTIFGDNWNNLVISQGLKDDIDTKLRAKLTNSKTEARLGFKADGSPVSLAQHIDEVKQLEAAGKITSNMRARYTASMVNLVDDIKNPEAPVAAKHKIVDYIFSPEGQGILGKIKQDYTDPITKQYVPGKYSVFQRLTSNDIVNEVKKMDSEHQMKYKNYLEREAGAELFQKEFLNLNRYAGHDDLGFRYDDGTKGGVPHVVLTDKDGKDIVLRGERGIPGTYSNSSNDRTSPYIYEVAANVARVNRGISGMSNVEKGLGGDVNAYLLDFLVNKAQVDMGKNWTGLPQKLVDAIATSRAPKKRIEDTFKDVK